MKKTKLTSLIIALTLVLQLFSAMTLSTSAAEYDKIGEYVSTAWNGRAYDTAFAEFNGKVYAYVGTVNASGAGGQAIGGIAVLDVTNPAAVTQVQVVEDGSIFLRDKAESRDKIYVKDDCLYVLNGANGNLQIFRINSEDGTISTSAIWSSGQITTTGNNLGVGTIKVIDDIMFVSSNYSNNVTLRLYNISDSDNPVLLTTETPVYPAMLETGDYSKSNCSEQIATFVIDAEDRGNGVYRVYGTNRAKFDSGNVDRYFLSIRDITVKDSSYTVETLYEGQPADTSYALGSGNAVYDVEVIDANTIAIADGSNNTNSGNTLQIIDVSTPSAPVLAAANEDNHEGMDVYSDGSIIAVAKKGSGTNVYTYDGTAKSLTKVKGLTPSSWSNDVGVYSGFFYIAGYSALTFYEYKTSISIESQEVKAIGGKIEGTVEGFLSATDSVNVTVGGKTYNAAVSGSKFTVATDEIDVSTVDVTAELTRSGSVKATATKTLTVTVLGNKLYNDLLEFSTEALKKITTTTGRYTDAVGVNVGNKKIIYAYTNAGLEVIDVTDIDNVTVTTKTAVKGNSYNSQMQIKDGYVIVVNCNNNRTVEFYKINADGSVADTPAASVGGNTDSSKVTTIEIVDDYLFEAQQGANQTMNIYDVSDIAGGVTKLGNTDTSYGVHGAEIQKISDTLYRAYYVTRTDNSPKGWSFCINDITIENGTVSCTQKYLGNAAEFDEGSDSTYSLYGGIKDIEYLGNNRLYIAIDQGAENEGLIELNVTDPTAPAVTSKTAGRAVAAKAFGSEYYAVAHGASLNYIKIYDDKNTQVKDWYTDTAIYNISEFDGKLLVSTWNELLIYDKLYTGIEVDETDIEIASSVKISVIADGYETGDEVAISINGEEYAVSSNGNGVFCCDYSPSEPETVSVTASLIRNSKTILVDAGEIDIVNEYSSLPEAIVDTDLTILSTTKPVDDSNASIWSSGNRASSAAMAEIGGRDIAYVISYNNIMVYDITNPQSPVLLQNNAVALSTEPRACRAEVKNGYLYAAKQNAICTYKINSDATLDLNTVITKELSGEIDGFTIIDDYMFVSLRTLAGILVYDISDSSDMVTIGQHTVVSRTQALTVEKIDNIYRAYFIEREDSAWYLGIYDISISGGKAAFTQRCKNGILTFEDKSAVKCIAKVDADRIAVGTDSSNNMDVVNVSNPSNPYVEYAKDSVRFQSGSAVAEGYFVYGTPDAKAVLHSMSTKSAVKTLSLDAGQVYETELYKGNLVFVCAEGLVIASAKTYIEIDDTILKGTSPKLTGKIVNFDSADRLLVSIDNGEAQEAAVNNGSFEVALDKAFDNADIIGVQLVIERNGTNAAGEYYAVSYLGAYPYSITDVTNTDGVKITVKKNYETDDSCKLYVAAYTDDALADADVLEVSEGTVSSDITFNAQTQTLKVFIWNENLVPAAEIAEPTFVEVSQNF